MAESRTSKSIKNAQTTVIFFFAQMLVGFWARKVLFEYLGSDVLGLEGTVGTLMGFLNLAELGIGSAVAFFLFKPMYDNDFKTMNEIVTVQGWIYRRIGAVIIGGAIIVMLFIPEIFKNIAIPLWYAYALFGVSLFNSMVTYFCTYRMCIISADQKDYQITKITQIISLGARVFLAFFLPYAYHPFIFYLCVNFISGVFGVGAIVYVLKRNYPWLKDAPEGGKELLKKYPGLLKKTKQIFVHRLAQVLIIEVQPMFMYAFSSLSAVAFYGNYVASLGKARDIIGSAFSSIQSSIGNLVASGDKERIWSVFWELMDSRIYIGAGSLIVLGLLTEPFISIWLSDDYLLGSTFLCILIAQYWISINRKTIENFMVGYGLFQDTWAPIVEAIIYCIFAIIFGHLWGLNGVLAGALTSNIIIIRIWKPYFLFTAGFKRNPWKDYFIPYFKRIVLVLINAIIIVWGNNTILGGTKFTNFGQIFLYGLVLTVVVFPLLYVEFILFSPGFGAFSKRIRELIMRKIQSIKSKYNHEK